MGMDIVIKVPRNGDNRFTAFYDIELDVWMVTGCVSGFTYGWGTERQAKRFVQHLTKLVK